MWKSEFEAPLTTGPEFAGHAEPSPEIGPLKSARRHSSGKTGMPCFDEPRKTNRSFWAAESGSRKSEMETACGIPCIPAVVPASDRTRKSEIGNSTRCRAGLSSRRQLPATLSQPLRQLTASYAVHIDDIIELDGEITKFTIALLMLFIRRGSLAERIISKLAVGKSALLTLNRPSHADHLPRWRPSPLK